MDLHHLTLDDHLLKLDIGLQSWHYLHHHRDIHMLHSPNKSKVCILYNRRIYGLDFQHIQEHNLLLHFYHMNLNSLKTYKKTYQSIPIAFYLLLLLLFQVCFPYTHGKDLTLHLLFRHYKLHLQSLLLHTLF